MTPAQTTRLAPSPTGALHLGNARTFLVNWAMARQAGWRVVLRIEDLDTPRVKADAMAHAVADLGWLGLDWDAGPFTQAADLSPYWSAVRELAADGHVCRCTCTRRDMEQAASAPHAGEAERRYPGTCRPRRWEGEAPDGAALRLRVPDGVLHFDDTAAGPQAFDVQGTTGDFVIWTKAGVPAYQLAVVVDDARQGVTQIVRGDDLLPSTARQLWLYRMLQLTPLPTYTHLPLVVGPDGRRLAKRHGDSRLAWYRDQGVAAERVIALLARWCGIPDAGDAMTAATFARRFDRARMPRTPAVFTPEDHQWLLKA